MTVEGVYHNMEKNFDAWNERFGWYWFGAEKVFQWDSEKFEKTALYRLAPMNTRFTIVTDSGLSEELKSLYEENGITVAVKG